MQIVNYITALKEAIEFNDLSLVKDTRLNLQEAEDELNCSSSRVGTELIALADQIETNIIAQSGYKVLHDEINNKVKNTQRKES